MLGTKVPSNWNDIETKIFDESSEPVDWRTKGAVTPVKN